MSKITIKTYDIINSAGDNLATVQATSQAAALKIWQETLWHRHPEARGVRAIEVASQEVA